MATFITSNVLGTSYETTDRYRDLKARGVGVSGVICSAYDNITHTLVAIKKIGKPFSSTAVAKRTYREVYLLSRLRHENLISLQDIFISPAEDIYLVTNNMMTDLHQLVQSKPLHNQFIQFFTYQILRGLKYIHSAGVIHRDLKPGNILVNENCDLKIIDFGLAREQEHHMTGYVVTRWYRAPEIMLTWQHYSYEIDIWSAGCILAEMNLARPLFPGKDHVHQFSLITELLGNPSKEVMERVYNPNTRRFIDNLPHEEGRPFSSVLKGVDPTAIDLLEKMVKFDPYQRITAADALSHPYVMTYHDSEDEPSAGREIDCSYEEDPAISLEEWKLKMYNEVLDFHQGACTGQTTNMTDTDTDTHNDALGSIAQRDSRVESY
ncbi:hypothetical protein P168DRAFT_276160 [Aspergillus campestris IBT 28561]|uniref:mitogen-activated protein kinase n=1 Tax=Aspergillus campestris (strain IBT 28561) TaxID=1392248 RepID=A0A2I1CRM1_ASPC2|nr:uncharacterized protein P168DRAFT_276160 [Aspergillus campestris IBT 28561]PKY00274.1 hypothetical protein P168DRAFT_276160 [Aspergillus campestris IBT 28561]